VKVTKYVHIFDDDQATADHHIDDRREPIDFLVVKIGDALRVTKEPERESAAVMGPPIEAQRRLNHDLILRWLRYLLFQENWDRARIELQF
jgi:hypothetical protein